MAKDSRSAPDESVKFSESGILPSLKACLEMVATNGRQFGLGIRAPSCSIKRGGFFGTVQIFGGGWAKLIKGLNVCSMEML